MMELKGNITPKPLVVVALATLTLFTARAQPGLLPFPSARDVAPRIHASVGLDAPVYSYNYDLSNGNGAKQPTDDFFVLIGSTPIVGASQPQFWGHSFMTVRSVRTFSWGALVPSATLWPGQAARRFTFTSTALPGIVFAHASGLIPPDTAADETEYDTTARDELSNSVSVTTVGPVVPLALLQPQYFLDTLNSYVVRSRLYGWITSQQTADEFTNYFSTVRAHLQAGNNGHAIRTLQHVLKSADSDSSSVLTSEAYALIRYNTEYLVSNLKATKR